MKQWIARIWRLRIWMDPRGQDLVEYALLAGFIAVAAGAVIPNVTSSMSNIYSRLASRLLEANGS